MKICITGTYGIPNRHGGFERFAEEVSVRLVERGHRVRVYQPSTHPFREKHWKGVDLVRRWFPRFAGPAAPLLFDLFSLRHALRSDAEIILQCGYTSSCWLPLLPRRKRKTILTHMDGMEWKRAKWGRLTRCFIRRTEKLAVKYSDQLITDHSELVKYYRDTYGVEVSYIPYGTPLSSPPPRRPAAPSRPPYCLLIARFEPENYIDLLIEGFLASGFAGELLVVGDPGTRYGKKLIKKYREVERIRFPGAVYDPEELERLRAGCTWYLHGHSAGGTNPSLVEAMAAGCSILAHDNPFNRGVLGSLGSYFGDATRLAALLQEQPDHRLRDEQVHTTRRDYDWDKVTERLEEMGRRKVKGI